MRKTKKLSKNMSYRERFKNQALTIKQLYGELAQAENVCFRVREDNTILKGEVEDLTAKCRELEKSLGADNSIKELYLNAINTQIKLDEEKEAEIVKLKQIADRRLFDITRLQKELDKVMKEFKEAKKPWWERWFKR